MQARALCLQQLADALPAVAEGVEALLLEWLDRPATLQQAQERRDAWLLFQRQRPQWLALASTELNRQLERFAAPPPSLASQNAVTSSPDEPVELTLVGEEAVETQILAARAALAALDKGGSAFNDLRLRLQHLENTDEIAQADPINALFVMQALVRAWTEAGFTREHWLLCQAALQPPLAQALAHGYQVANDFLLGQGVLPEIDLRGLVRRAPVPPGSSAPPVSDVATTTEAAALPAAALPGSAAGTGASDGQDAHSDAAPARLMRFLAEHLPQSAAWLQGGQAASSPPGLDALPPGAAPALPAASSAVAAMPSGTAGPSSVPPIDWHSLEQALAAVRAQARTLKSSAGSDQEKAVIEVVALIFDSILAEERIPSSIRVWFARLQMPVLRLAVTDPGFIASEQHPARQLMDRMGACVLGYDASQSLEPLEQEIRRIVQVIEQYPETGRRVFELMLQEFQVFMEQYLRAQGGVEQLASAAQQLEQREILTVQYTIELRKLLGSVAVRDAVRDFLFQTWTEVMAQAAVLYGAHDERALQLRRAAAELLWAVSAKASRQERAKVIASVPALLARLREGMALLGFTRERQEAELKVISDLLAEAFMSRAEAVDPQWLDDLTRQLAALEDYLPEDEVAEITLDRDNVELITGVDASDITVLPNTDASLQPEAQARAAALELGAWCELEHNGQLDRVQLAWRSERGQLCLFVAAGQHSYLMQQGRVASYLQSGLLRPQASESLTARATRDALDKLDANPERLLA